MQKNNQKGQALVEFIIILPIFIFMLLATIDLGKILYIKNNLESKMDDVISDYKANQSSEEIANNIKKDDKTIELQIKKEEENYISFELKKTTDILTPGLNLIFKTPYDVTTKRVIRHE